MLLLEATADDLQLVALRIECVEVEPVRRPNASFNPK
jgi:hypothetical protein